MVGGAPTGRLLLTAASSATTRGTSLLAHVSCGCILLLLSPLLCVITCAVDNPSDCSSVSLFLSGPVIKVSACLPFFIVCILYFLLITRRLHEWCDKCVGFCSSCPAQLLPTTVVFPSHAPESRAPQGERIDGSIVSRGPVAQTRTLGRVCARFSRNTYSRLLSV